MFYLDLITDVKSLLKVGRRLDAFVVDNSSNPFLLCGFIKEFMNFAFSKKCHPLIFVASVNQEIVGVAPFVLKRRFFASSANFLHAFHFSPDVIVKEEYRRVFLEQVFNLIFDYLNCKLFDLILPSSSPNISVIKSICEENCINCCLSPMPYMSHCVVSVESSWSDFEKVMGSNFRRYFKRIERKMIEAGGYEVISADKFDDIVFQNILYVERRSWKEKWRRQKRVSADEELLKILDAIKEISPTLSTFKSNVYFLKINGELASYALTIRFKDTGYIVKTSFNDKHRNFYPGTYIVNVAVRDFFEHIGVRKIDFQTNLPFMEKWKPVICSRTRIMMGQKSFYSCIANIFTNRVFCIFRDQFVSPFITRLIPSL